MKGPLNRKMWRKASGTGNVNCSCQQEAELQAETEYLEGQQQHAGGGAAGQCCWPVLTQALQCMTCLVTRKKDKIKMTLVPALSGFFYLLDGFIWLSARPNLEYPFICQLARNDRTMKQKNDVCA